MIKKVKELCDYAGKLHGPSPGENDFQDVLKVFLEDQFYIVSF